ncbi:DUF6234 family protein [Streptomyces sp. NPDC058579]|uniref:DUF6234 family protein n=1 Tax=Streptomyces sp. NPDC058579 TaxID=3346548 RepID=UPI0036626369
MTTSRRQVRTGADIATGVAFLALQCVLALAAAVFLAMRKLGSGRPGPASSGPPPMDWVPVIVFGTVTGAALLLAVAMLRGGWVWTAGGQFLAMGLLGLATLLIAAEEWTYAHPDPAPASTPVSAPTPTPVYAPTPAPTSTPAPTASDRGSSLLPLSGARPVLR